MSRLYGSLKGQAKTTATRRAHSSIECHVRGWHTGVMVHGYINDKEEDTFEVSITSGSNGNRTVEVLGWVRNGKFETYKDVIGRAYNE